MADVYSRYDDPEVWTGGRNLHAAMDQHERARHATESAGINWLSVVGGGFLAGAGISRGGSSGLLMTLLGGGFVYWGMSQGVGALPNVASGTRVPEGERSIRVDRVITINRPAGEVYAAWRDVESLPAIMSHLESVTRTEDGLTHWVAKAPLGRTIAWNAEIMNDDAGRVISWRSVEGSGVQNVGAVHFQQAPAGIGTELRVRIEYSPPAGALGATVARLFGEEPSQQIADDLRRFKAFMETGDYPTAEGQPRGGHRQSVVDPLLRKVRHAVDPADTVVRS